MNSPNHKSIVAKDNKLIGQMAKFKLSELRLIAYCLAHFDSRKLTNRSFTASVDDLASLFPMDHKSAYAVVHKAVLGVNLKPLEIETEKEIQFWNWFSGFIYKKKTGQFEFRITSEIQPYLLKLEGTFTRYRLENVYQFRAASTWKLYENLKRWQAKKTWSVELDELRLSLGVAGKYTRWNNFRQRVIDSAIGEINKTSDLDIKYETEKRCRRVVGLVFLIDTKQTGEVITQESNQEILYKSLISYGIAHKTAAKHVQKADFKDKIDVILDKLPKMVENAKNKHVPLAKYINGAINQELNQGKLSDLFDGLPKPPDHKDALDCWTAKRQKGEKCKVRKRATPGQRKKCQICLNKLSIETFGV